MKEETYKKVFIRSEADLPKEHTTYIVFDKSRYGKCVMYLEYNPYDPESIADWMSTIDWYLKPVELVSDADIEKAALRLFPPSRNLGKTVRYGYKIGAIEMRNGKIVKSNEKTEYGKYEFD